MAIAKQEFYEGAALHRLARTGKIMSIRYEMPFFLLNENLLVLLKYSTRGRSPWAFTFTADEQAILQRRAAELAVVIGLICGGDGIAAIGYEAYRTVAAPRELAIHIGCHRLHGEHYEVNGPDGTLRSKVAPSSWLKILDEKGDQP